MTETILKVLALTRYDRMGASSRLRFNDYQPLLEAQGIRITFAPFFDDAYLRRLYAGQKIDRKTLLGYYRRRLAALRTARNYDLVWLEKEALPWIPAWIESRLLRSRPYVIDFDDAWFYRYEKHVDPTVRFMLQGKFSKLVQRATVTVVGNKYLAGWATAQKAKPVVRIPTNVDLPRYKVAPYPSPPRPFTIGWMGSPSSAKYLAQLSQALTELAEDDEFELVVAGADNAEVPGVHVRHVAWSEEAEPGILTGFDVGIMPLDADMWSEGKCAYKLIQYMAAGLPVIASPIGMNRDVVKDSENGYLASSAEEWLTALRALKDDPVLRQEMGKAGRSMVEQEYTLAGNAPRIADVLKKAAERGRKAA